jgi:cell wall assembly regulator SMI1
MSSQPLFRELLKLVENTRPEYVKQLGGGYSRVEIQSSIQMERIPEDLFDIYSCVSGDSSEIDFFSGLIPGYDLFQLKEINEQIQIFQEISAKYLTKISESTSDKFDYWQPDMIPFLHDGSGDNICVRTLPDDESVWIIPKVTGCRKLNSSLNRFILTAIECYRQGAYFIDPDDEDEIWDTDWDLAKEIVKNIDPEIEDYSPP